MLYIRYIYQNYMKISWNTVDKIFSKKLPLASTIASRWLWNLLLAFPTVSLRELVNAAVIFAFSSCPTHKNQAELQSGELDSQMLEVMWVQKFSGSQLWILLLVLPYIGSSSGHPLNPGQYHLFQALDVDLHFEPENMWEDEWRRNITIASDHTKYYDVHWVFGFHQYECESFLRLTTKHCVLVV